MTTRPLRILTALVLATALTPGARGQTTAFTYQGRLDDGGVPASGLHDFRFYMRDAATAGNPVGATNTFDGITPNPPNPASPPVTVDNDGLFTVLLEFGSTPLNGQRLWLQIETKPHGSGNYVAPLPRQELTPAPYAIYAQTAGDLTGALPGSRLSGTSSSALTLNNPANSFKGNGGGLTGLNASSVSSGTLADARLSANVALLDRTQTFTGNNSFGNLTVNAPSALSFGATTRQMLNLYATAYGIGVQPYTHYFRTDAGASFAWYEGGVHSNLFQNPGLGGTKVMTLSSYDGLHLSLPSSSNPINAMLLDVQSFGTIQNAADSLFLSCRDIGSGRTQFAVKGDGSVGIGTSTPGAKLQVSHLGGVGVFSGDLSPFGAAAFESNLGTATTHAWFAENGNRVFSVTGGGQGFFAGDISMNGGQSIISSGRLHIQANEDLFLNPWGGAGTVHVGGGGGPGNLEVVGSASVCSLTIRGGCDLAEPFEMTDSEIPKGSLVIIDEEHEGKLKLAGQAYDTRVAGIVSGANGVNPGISLHQEGVIEGGQNVALSGRVFARADASNGPIKPGDLLTSSSTPGHVMKVTDHTRAQGAIVGKAMSALKQGKGMVLVLVSLQ